MVESDTDQQPEETVAPVAMTPMHSMPRINPPSELHINSTKEDNFVRFKSRWQSFYVLSRLDRESQEYQCVLLLYTAGSDASRVVESSERYQEEKTCQAILGILQQYCVGDRYAIHERYKFKTRSQLTGETFDSFYTDLRALANKCAFDYRPKDTDGPSPLDEMLRG